MELEDLIVLIYADNNCYVKAIDLDDVMDGRLTIDLEHGTWSYDFWKNVKIGMSRNMNSRDSHPATYGIIGIYDRTVTEHLNSMAHAAREFTFPQNGVNYID